MGTAASSFLNPIAAELEGADPNPTAKALSRRAKQRRHTLAAQVASYALGAAVLLIYAHAGTIGALVPSAFFLCGVSLIGVFAVLSETHVNDRFEDHYLTVYQVGGHIVIQLGFLLAAPQIGYAFLNVLFLIFAVASLRMTSRQAAIAWILATSGVAQIFLLTRIPIGMPLATATERFAAALCFVLTIGQCAFVGLYGDSLRKQLYKRGVELSEANKRIEQLDLLARKINSAVDEKIGHPAQGFDPACDGAMCESGLQFVEQIFGSGAGFRTHNSILERCGISDLRRFLLRRKWNWSDQAVVTRLRPPALAA